MNSRSIRRLLVPALAAAWLAGCSFVKLSEGGSGVRVVPLAEAAHCQQVGHTTVSLLAKVGPFDRSPKRVQAELDILARNSAVDLGGDAVARLAPPVEGKQRYTVYVCGPPRNAVPQP